LDTPIVPSRTVRSAAARLCQPVASSGCVDGVEIAVLGLDDRKDALGIASTCNALVKLGLLSGWPATSARILARGLAVLTPHLTVCRRQRCGPTWRPFVSAGVITVVPAGLRPIAAQLNAPFGSSVRVGK
jgi:hypothetical protein